MKSVFFLVSLFTITQAYSQSPVMQQAARIDSLLQQYASLDQFSGSILVARKDTVILAKGYGLANREWNIPAQASTRFRIASLTKQFTGMLIMQLKQAGKLDLQSPVSKYLPWYPRRIGDRVTIHQLLTHTAGIPNFTNRPDFFSTTARQEFSTRDFVLKYCTDSLESRPGTRFNYSNTGYYILGAVIEEITHKSFAEVLKEQILDVAGMTDSGVDVPDNIIADRASGYEQPYGVWQNARFINTASTIGAAGDMYSTVQDLYRWNRALYGDKLLNEANKKILFTPALNDYAYGIGVVKIRIGGEKDSVVLMAHTGGINGFRAKILRIPDTEEVIIALSNTSDDFSTADISAITLNMLLALHDQPYTAPATHIVTETGKKLLTGSVGEAISFYQQAKNNPVYDTSHAMVRLESLGRYLSDIGRRKDGIAILKFNTELFPGSAQAHDSYADELEEDNQLREAVIHYRKTLLLDPTNQHARRALQRLGQKP